MPHATARANAPAMPIDRRSALASLAATGGLFLAPRAAGLNEGGRSPKTGSGEEPVSQPPTPADAARAVGDDAALFSQVERVVALHEAAQAHAGDETEAGEFAFDRAVDALAIAQDALLEMQPQTFAGLRAMAAALVASDAFGLEEMAADLAQTIVDMPAPGEVFL